MDLSDAFQTPLQDFFEQSRLNALALPLEAGKFDDEEEIFRFADSAIMPQEEIAAVQNHEDLLHLEGSAADSHSLPEGPGPEVAGRRIDGLLVKDEGDGQDDLLNDFPSANTPAERQTGEESIAAEVLQSLITFLVQCPAGCPLQLQVAVRGAFPQLYRVSVVQVLVQKFSRLRKTKEQLIKYCMRKAFKFILQLPQNSHLYPASPSSSKKEKPSFSRCRNRYLNRISEQKSMNSKFLQQVFSEGDFKRDYFIFLSHFEAIILDDNARKITYLAQLLTTHKKDKARTAEMVRRLPWTNTILEKVRNVARELLKYGCNGEQ